MRAQKRKKSVWNKQRIAREKRWIKESLDAHSVQPVERLKAALQKIDELGEQESELGQLRRFIYAVSCLFHHGRYGGLKDPQVRRLANIAEAILKIQGIRETTSKLAFLHGELYLALSQIYRRSGEHWQAAWGQQVSEYLSYKTPAGGKGFQRMVNAIRSLRLGHAQLAIQEVGEAVSLGVPVAKLWRLRLEEVRALRLSGQWKASLKLVEDFENDPNIIRDIRLEFQWERLSIEAMRFGRLDSMFEVVRKGRTHHKYGYILELFLWTRAIRSREWIERFARAKYIARNQTLDPRAEPVLYRCAELLEDCYDFEIPFLLRLRKAPLLMDQARFLPTVDKEMLVWAAVARWLARTKSPKLAALVLAEYQAMSYRLTRGMSSDVFNLLKDLADRPWFKSSASAKHLELIGKTG